MGGLSLAGGMVVWLCMLASCEWRWSIGVLYFNAYLRIRQQFWKTADQGLSANGWRDGYASLVADAIKMVKVRMTCGKH